MFKKSLICFVVFAVAAIPLQASAEQLEGKVTALSLNERAPYTGVLLDPIAASKMIVDQKYLRVEIELELTKNFQQELADKRLSFDLLKVNYDSLRKIHEETMILKNEQIADLNILLKEEVSNSSNNWEVVGGMTVGILMSVAVFYASVEITK
tara:strand:- start:224 stop:682 length:459 start_codon:yes stop_codon:yes gene_type:complete